MRRDADRWRAGIGVFLLLCAVGVGGCATGSSGDPPAWTRGAGGEYPATAYVLGVGEGDTGTRAEERAYAAVAKIFQARVQAESRDWQSYWTSGTPGVGASGQRQTVDSLIRVSTDKVLEQVRILDRWVDPDSGRHVVLAGIPRAQAEQALLERLAEYDADIEQFLAQASHPANKLEYLQSLHQAIDRLMRRNMINADLRVIRVNGMGVPSPHHLGELSRQLQQFLDEQFVVRVDIKGDQADSVRGAVIHALTQQGLTVHTTEGDESGVRDPAADLVVRGNTRMWDVELPDPLFVYVRWCGEMEVHDPVAHQILGTVSDSGREGHVTRQAARTRAAHEMGARLGAQVSTLLAAVVFGESTEPAVATGAGCLHH